MNWDSDQGCIAFDVSPRIIEWLKIFFKRLFIKQKTKSETFKYMFFFLNCLYNWYSDHVEIGVIGLENSLLKKKNSLSTVLFR